MKVSRIFGLALNKKSLIALIGLLFGGTALAAGAVSAEVLDLTAHWVGYTSLLIFVIAYALVMGEEFTHLRKSKPVILAAGIMWLLVAVAYGQSGQIDVEALERDLVVDQTRLFQDNSVLRGQEPRVDAAVPN